MQLEEVELIRSQEIPRKTKHAAEAEFARKQTQIECKMR